jgi:CRISPR-associated protein Csb1
MNAATLTKMVVEDAALRRRQRLQPVGGKGDKIFPPTYPGEVKNAPPRHVFERRRLDSREVWCVLVDSVQSQANRLEESLLGVIRDPESSICIPHVFVDFKGKDLAGIETITSLEAPHRVYDAIFRDSRLGEQPFMDSDLGKRLKTASNADASALLEVSPTALLFGSWHSTGQGGGLGAKFARCLVSEIVAVEVPVNVENAKGRDLPFVVASGDSLMTVEPVSAGRRTGSRIDPLGILSNVKIYKKDGADDWTSLKKEAEKNEKGDAKLYVKKDKSKAGKPSVINHGNIRPQVDALGISCDYIEQIFVLSFAALRRLRFGSDNAKNEAGRALLAALGLLAVTEQDAQGYALRSRCDLVCDGKSPLQLVHADGTTVDMTLNVSLARDLYRDAFDAAKHAGFTFQETGLSLTPEPKLVDIVLQSQKMALSGEGGEDEEP